MRPEATGDSNPSSPFRNDECVALSALPAKQRYNVAMQHPKPNRHSVDCGRRHCGFSAGMAGPAVHAINGRPPASAGPVDRHIAITMARTPMQFAHPACAARRALVLHSHRCIVASPAALHRCITGAAIDTGQRTAAAPTIVVPLPPRQAPPMRRIDRIAALNRTPKWRSDHDHDVASAS